MFGLDVLNRMRVAGAEGDAIVISAANEAETVERAVRLGVVNYLLKPFTADDLRQRLTQYQAHRRRRRPEDPVRPGRRRPALGSRRGRPAGVAAQGPEPGDRGADRAGADGRPRASCRRRSARTPSASPGSARAATWSTSPGRGRSVVSLRYGAVGRPERRYGVAQPGSPPPRPTR